MFFQRTILDSYGVASATSYGHVKVASLTHSSTDAPDYCITCKPTNVNSVFCFCSSCQAKGKYTVQFSLGNGDYSYDEITVAVFDFINCTPYFIRPIGYNVVSCRSCNTNTDEGSYICINNNLGKMSCTISPGNALRIASLCNKCISFESDTACVLFNFSYMLEKYVAWV